MSDTQVIEGWTCWVMPSGIRAASPSGKNLRNLFSYSAHGLAVSGVLGETLQAPPVVLKWLLEPILEQAVQDYRDDQDPRDSRPD